MKAQSNTIFHENQYALFYPSIFVFDSNLQGIHEKGAALQARTIFGAVPGIGTGLMGNCYAIPTKLDPYHRLNLPEIQVFVTNFNKLTHTLLIKRKFFITRIGYGLAGYTDEKIAPMFKLANRDNCIFPINWKPYL